MTIRSTSLPVLLTLSLVLGACGAVKEAMQAGADDSVPFQAVSDAPSQTVDLGSTVDVNTVSPPANKDLPGSGDKSSLNPGDDVGTSAPTTATPTPTPTSTPTVIPLSGSGLGVDPSDPKYQNPGDDGDWDIGARVIVADKVTVIGKIAHDKFGNISYYYANIAALPDTTSVGYLVCATDQSRKTVVAQMTVNANGSFSGILVGARVGDVLQLFLAWGEGCNRPVADSTAHILKSVAENITSTNK